MSVQINEIKDVKLQEIAKQVDNGDGALKKEEYSVFAQEASRQGFDSKSIHEALNMKEGGVKAWWHDVDKISTDGKDDGKISNVEKAGHFLNGLLAGIVKNVAKKPAESLASMALFAAGSYVAGAAISALTAGAVAAGPIGWAVGLGVGLCIGIPAIVKGFKQAKNAKTDGEVKSGMENAGTGAAVTLLSVLGFRDITKGLKVKTAKINRETRIVREVETPTKVKSAEVESVKVTNEFENTSPVKVEVKTQSEITTIKTSDVTRTIEVDNAVQLRIDALKQIDRYDYWNNSYNLWQTIKENPKLIEKMFSLEGKNGRIFKNGSDVVSFMRALGSKNPKKLLEVLDKPEMQQLLLMEETPCKAAVTYNRLIA